MNRTLTKDPNNVFGYGVLAKRSVVSEGELPYCGVRSSTIAPVFGVAHLIEKDKLRQFVDHKQAGQWGGPSTQKVLLYFAQTGTATATSMAMPMIQRWSRISEPVDFATKAEFGKYELTRGFFDDREDWAD